MQIRMLKSHIFKFKDSTLSETYLYWSYFVCYDEPWLLYTGELHSASYEDWVTCNKTQ